MYSCVRACVCVCVYETFVYGTISSHVGGDLEREEVCIHVFARACVYVCMKLVFLMLRF